ncbi:NfeD family protein [Leptothermofonsia sp. ETS-13]|uniref:NfeD family protein n=1 Tax=Leptothermofonsia sp. ETS-13 TaxID=3035696 RepID=UPI003B9F2DAB
MTNFTRFLRNLLSKVTPDLDDRPADSFNREVSFSNYQSDRYEAIVTQTICPGKTGQVKFQGSWWTARCNREVILVPGQVVYVVERHDNTLYVEPGFMLRIMQPALTRIPA